jgi:hypothetical protein
MMSRVSPRDWAADFEHGVLRIMRLLISRTNGHQRPSPLVLKNSYSSMYEAANFMKLADTCSLPVRWVD